MVAAVLVTVGAFTPAVRAAVQGRVWASPVSWTVWAALGVVALVAQVEMGGAPQIAATAVLAVAAAVMAAAAAWTAWQGTAPRRDALAWQHYVDAVCAVGAATAFVLLLLATAEAAIMLTIATDLIAAVPTAVAAWRQPHTQSAGVFYAIAVAAGLAILAGGSPARLIDVAYLLYLFVMNVALVAVIFAREGWLDRPRSAPASPPWTSIPSPAESWLPPYTACLQARRTLRGVDRP